MASYSYFNSFSYGQVGPKRAREMWFLSRFYTADEADKMGLVNTVVPVSAANLIAEIKLIWCCILADALAIYALHI